MDLILLKRINLNNDTIISTEHTFQSGAFKSKELKTSSISLIKFIKNDKFLEKVLNKCYLNINSKKRFPFYNIFKDKLKTDDNVKKYQAEPNEFCPIPWWNTSEIYKFAEEYSTKYNVKIPNQKEILNTATSTIPDVDVEPLAAELYLYPPKILKLNHSLINFIH